MLDQIVARASTLVTHKEPARIFTEFGRHPRLFRAWLPFGSALLLFGQLPRVDTELVVLRTAHNCGCADEWTQHEQLAARAGLSPDAIAAVRDGHEAAVWTDRQRLLLRAADELHARRRIGRATRDALDGVLSDRQMIELCLLVGHYEMLAMLLNTNDDRP